ncbi:MAG: TonB-dependent receptor [Rhodanobacter sp.]|nr:MAG: TonB-dependent receptor [Rhodanobacter sp.]
MAQANLARLASCHPREKGTSSAAVTHPYKKQQLSNGREKMQQKILAHSVRKALLAIVGTTLGLATGAVCAGTPTATGSGTPASIAASGPAVVVQASQSSTQTHKNAKNQANKKDAVQLQAVTVSAGIQASQQRSIDIKRNAPNIEDSITAVNIGELPDVSITDSLQRLTGVQIDRSAGEGTSISVRGLPEVGTTLNGMPFITADNIDSIQPNYGTLPAALFSGVDVFKSPTASMLDSGISGTVNLRTYQPFDFDPGWSITGSAEGGRGSVIKKNGPNLNTTINYNDGGKWGALLSASYSDSERNNSSNGFYDGGRIGGENASDANSTSNDGFISGWGSVPVPPSIVQLPDGSVEVGGIKNAAFLIPGDGAMTANYASIRRKRLGLHAAFSASLGDSFLLDLNGFYTKQKQGAYDVNAVPDGLNHNVATLIPTAARGTGVTFINPTGPTGAQDGDWNQQFYTTQGFNYYLGSFRSATTATQTDSAARNFTAKLTFDNGGPFTAHLALADNTATSRNAYADIQFVQADGTAWGNHLMPGMSLPPGYFPGPSGSYQFNPGGMVAGSEIAGINLRSDNPISISPALAAKIADPNTYVNKGFDSSGGNQSASNHYAHLDGAFEFNPDLTVKAGISNSIRSASNNSWVGLSPLYAGNGASDPNGCLVRWVYADQILDGGGVPGACTASNAIGYFHGNPLGNTRLPDYPASVSDHLRTYNVGGVTIVGLDPHAISNPMAFINSLAPGTQHGADPTSNWNVSVHTVKAFGEAVFSGTLGDAPFDGNFGMRYVHMNLGVTQFLSGPPAAYGAMSPASGSVQTANSHDYWLPALNFAVHMTPSLTWRFAMSKNMMPLTLDQWGGGISESFQAVAITLPNGQHVLPVSGASSNGNPDLKPWQSTNYDTSLEYYFGKGSMVSLALFDMKIASFVQSSGSVRCDLPDADGVVRDRCVPVNTLVQGEGAQLKGAEVDYKQAFTFLPGWLSHTGAEINGTYSPSTTGKKDLANNTVPFPGNSEKSGNFILWYQDNRWQARLALNYRSKELISTNWSGVTGLDEYVKPQTYLAASVTYKVNPNLQFYIQGQNLTNEKQKYYLTWPDQAISTGFSERYVMLGARVHF